jgi:Lhr-like helicase
MEIINKKKEYNNYKLVCTCGVLVSRKHKTLHYGSSIHKNFEEMQKIKPNNILCNDINKKWLDDIIKKWLDNTFIYTKSAKDCIKSTILMKMFENSGNKPINNKDFKKSLIMNGINYRLLNGTYHYYGLKERIN